jgi:branched-chain amino acid transport system permease protein
MARRAEIAKDRLVSLLSLVAVAITLAVLIWLPFVLNLYWTRVLADIFVFAVMAQSVNIIAGFVGYPAFGNVVFFGLGAYGMGVMTVHFQMSPAAGMLAALLVCSTVVVLIGPPLLRLRGHYFAIATLGLNEVIKSVTTNLTDLTGGAQGLSFPQPGLSYEQNAVRFYLMFLALAVLGTVVTLALQLTRFGYACRAIRANEEGAESTGIDATYYKTAAWLISALLAGAAGALYAKWLGYIEPPAVFDMTISVKAFVMFLLGGAGTIFGPVIGAALVELSTTLSWSYLLQFHLAVLGIIIMGAAILMPDGIQAFAHASFSYAYRLFARKS